MNTDHIYQVNRAIDYIINNLQGDLDVEIIAKHCNFAKFHFGRIFKSVIGESLYGFIKRMKIEYSAFLLHVNDRDSVTDIGEKFGYSASNYSTLFKKYYQTSPATFRQLHNSNLLSEKLLYKGKDFNYYNDKVRYLEIKEFVLVYERHICNYNETQSIWLDFMSRHDYLYSGEAKYVEICNSDPDFSDENRCVYDIGISVTEKIEGKNHTTLQGGKYATYTYCGPACQIGDLYEGMLKFWLLQSEHVIDNRKIFSIYDGKTKLLEDVSLTIYIPIK